MRTDNEWESWGMKDLLDNLQQWLKRNKMTAETSKPSDSPRKERQWWTQKGEKK